MKHLENAFRFVLKNYIIAVPVFIALAIPALIGQSATFSFAAFGKILSLFQAPDTLRNPFALLGAITPFFFAVGAAGIIGTLLRLAATPAAAGMIKKGLDGDTVVFDDVIPKVKEHFVQCLIYWVANIVVSIIIGVVFVILVAIFGALVLILKGFGVFLLIIVILAAVLASIAVMVLLSMWLPAMIIDNMNVMDAAKKSISIAKNNFWTILGITVLIAIIGGIAGSIVGAIFGFIPLIGAIIAAVVPALVEVLRMTFYFMFYREESVPAEAA